MNRTLWIVQGLLALFLGLASAAPKLLLPPEMLPPLPIPLPRPFLLFIGVAELLGAVGLMLPGLLGIRPALTPLAAAGLALIALGGAGYQFASNEPGNTLFAAVVASLCAFVAYGRWRLVPHRARSAQPVFEAAR